MRATTFEHFTVNTRVRYISDVPQYEPRGTITEVDGVSEHILIEWDDEHPSTSMDALSAIRLLEVL
jgi:hypothetical protein